MIITIKVIGWIIFFFWLISIILSVRHINQFRIKYKNRVTEHVQNNTDDSLSEELYKKPLIRMIFILIFEIIALSVILYFLITY